MVALKNDTLVQVDIKTPLQPAFSSQKVMCEVTSQIHLKQLQEQLDFQDCRGTPVSFCTTICEDRSVHRIVTELDGASMCDRCWSDRFLFEYSGAMWSSCLFKLAQLGLACPSIS